MERNLVFLLVALFNLQTELLAQPDNIMLQSEKSAISVKQIMLPGKFILEYTETGNKMGIPVILLHGYSDSRLSYQKILPFISESIHVYAVTMRGHGNSGHPEHGYSPVDFANDIAEFMKLLHIPKAILVGHSLGATVVQRFALDHPELVKGIVLVAALPSFSENQTTKEMAPAIAGLSDPVDPEFVAAFQKEMVEKPIPAEELNLYISESLKLKASTWKSIMNSFGNVDYRKDLQALKIPALILWGDKDIVSTKAEQLTLQKALPHSQLKIYDNLGHSIHWEEPALFVRDLESFIFSLHSDLN